MNATQDPATQDPTSPIRVLMVEDNPGDARLIQALLDDAEGRGFGFTVTQRLEDALGLVGDGRTDVVLLDLNLPDSSGLETLRLMLGSARDVPIVVVTGLDDSEAGLQAIREGAQDYLVKGQSGGDLIARTIRYSVERKRLQQRIHRLSNFDPLTGLPNRDLFTDRVEQALRRHRSAGSAGAGVVVMMMDLDRFKNINELEGRDRGDRVLIEMARRFAIAVPHGETVGRIGNDEFAILLEGVRDSREAAMIGRTLLGRAAEPVPLPGGEANLSASIGISVHPGDGDDAIELVRNADTALAQAKRQGGNRLQFMTPVLNARATRHLRLETALRRALRDGGLELHYQPVVELASGTVCGFEALLRWHSDEFGRVSPEEAVPIAESNDLIVPLGEWVLETAGREARRFCRDGRHLGMAVNVSVSQIVDEAGFSGLLAAGRRLRAEGLSLHLEVTETVLAQRIDLISARLSELRDAGFRIAIDDFGKGFSSLSYLKQLPVDLLKLDKDFIADVLDSDHDRAIVEAVATLASRLGYDVIAEGIERPDQLRFLTERGVRFGQGYLFSPPRPAAEMHAMITQRPAFAIPNPAAIAAAVPPVTPPPSPSHR